MEKTKLAFMPPNPQHHKVKSGFTLAEVLITLAIIGVVAALTIPTVVRNYQRQQYLVSIKKFYSVFSQGIKKAMAQNNCTDMACLDWFDNSGAQDAAWNQKIAKEVAQTFNVIATCDNTGGACEEFKGYKLLNKASLDTNLVGKYYVFTLSDGMIVGFTNISSTPAYPELSKIKWRATYLIVDTNGKKGPNMAGRDFFQFFIAQDGTIYADTSEEWAKSTYGEAWASGANFWKNSQNQCGLPGSSVIGTGGTNCAARIMDEGWQMNY